MPRERQGWVAGIEKATDGAKPMDMDEAAAKEEATEEELVK